jgi:hypothetical protein
MFSLLNLLSIRRILPGCGGDGGGSGSNSSNSPPTNPPNISVTLGWDAPTTRLDGSPITENEISDTTFIGIRMTIPGRLEQLLP